jgi:hypothetical protein
MTTERVPDRDPLVMGRVFASCGLGVHGQLGGGEMGLMPPISFRQLQYEGRIIPEVVIINDPNPAPVRQQPVVRVAPADPWGEAVNVVRRNRAEYEAMGGDVADQAKRLRIEQIRAGGYDEGDENEGGRRGEDNDEEDDEDDEVRNFHVVCLFGLICNSGRGKRG